ncbi:MAG: endonuclease domain-containing protein [Nitrospinae bacterium]|nr:endonuclease domain-containing protein [Nitrospinota bacterium]
MKNPNKTLARVLRKDLTDAERKLWSILRNRQLESFKFRRQHPFGNYILDFVYLEKKLVLEVDGGQHFANKEDDDERTQWLESEGYKVLRFWNREVFMEKESVLAVICNALTKV